MRGASSYYPAGAYNAHNAPWWETDDDLEEEEPDEEDEEEE